MPPFPAPKASGLRLSVLVAIALVGTVFIGIIAAVANGPLSWAFFAVAITKLLRLPTWDQWLFLAAWAALTGALFTIGAGAAPRRVRTRLFGLVSGILVPAGLVVLARFLSRYWPDTSGPFDSPPLTLFLVLYGLLIPWLLGRVAFALSREKAP
jgi:hypothetical protein